MLRKAKYKRFVLLALSKQLSFSSTSGTETPVALALFQSTGVEITHIHLWQKIIKLTTELLISGRRCSIRDAGWHFPCTHAAGRGVDQKHTERSACVAWVLHGPITSPSLYFSTNCFQLSLSSPHSSWSSGRLMARNVPSCTSATVAPGRKQNPSCSHLPLQSTAGSGTPASTSVQVGRKYRSYLNKQIHSVNATCGQTGSPKAHRAAPQLVQSVSAKDICSEITASGSKSQALWQGRDKRNWNWEKEERKGKIRRKLNVIFQLHINGLWREANATPNSKACVATKLSLCTLTYFCSGWILWFFHH